LFFIGRYVRRQTQAVLQSGTPTERRLTFLAMMPSVLPKVGSMQVDTRHAYIQTTPQLQIAKLIPRASNRVNDGTLREL
jgi:hypothetical protein